MTSWPECEFIIIEGPEAKRTFRTLHKTGWESVVFILEDEETSKKGPSRTPRVLECGGNAAALKAVAETYVYNPPLTFSTVPVM
jgi:hypothetical protein